MRLLGEYERAPFLLKKTATSTLGSKINFLSQNLKHQEPERERSEKEAGTEKKIDVTPIKEQAYI